MRLEYAPPDDPSLAGRIDVLVEPFEQRQTGSKD
jgi:hypothetical protein